MFRFWNPPLQVNRQPQSTQQARNTAAPPLALQRRPAHTTSSTNPHWHQLATQLPVSQPGDPAEIEADRVADRILRDPPQVPSAPVQTGDTTLHRKCAGCASSPTPCPGCEEEQRVQRKESSPSAPDLAANPATAASRPGNSGSGQPLDSSTRAFFEPRFGRDLGGVRIHNDSKADASARAVNALAYTLGRDVVFRSGQFAPQSPTGQRLLAHELAHVAQSGDHTTPMIRRSAVPASPSENGEPAPGGENPVIPGLSDPPPAPQLPTGPPPKPETCPPPEDLACATGPSPAAPAKNYVFPVGSAVLTAAEKRDIDTVATSWTAGGGSGSIQVDGYASAEGPCGMNWQLSCRRAQAVANELMHPSDGSAGVGSASIKTIAHGESDEAGRGLAANRRATITFLSPLPAPVPTPTPATCAFPFSLGVGRTNCGTGADFNHFDLPTVSTRSEVILSTWAAIHNTSHLPFRSMVSDLDCLTEFTAVLGGLAGSEGLSAVSHFVGGSGSTVTHGASSALGSAALGTSTFKATLRTVQSDIESQLASQASGGSLDPCALSVVPPATSFRWNGSAALIAVVGGTQGEELFATGFTGDASLRTYSIGLKFVICDDFGLDEADLYGPGLIPFWILQHERSPSLYAPFINQIELPVTLAGTF